MSSPDCWNYENCSAPLCPLDRESETCGWFPDEDVCILKDAPAWVKVQRKLSKYGIPWTAGYFTIEMLKHPCPMGRGAKGLDPDRDPKTRPEDVERWKSERRIVLSKKRGPRASKGSFQKAV